MIIVNIFVALTALENGHMQFNWQPLMHMGGDNTSGNCWATKFSNSNKFARKLTKLLAMAQKHLGINVLIKHVIGKLNRFADAVSRGYSSVRGTYGIRTLRPDHLTSGGNAGCGW